MTRNNKIKAFTISEMIVVLILTSIVVGLAFSVLSLVQKQMFSIEENLKQHTIRNKLETSLWLDFNRFGTIKYNSLEQELYFNSEIDSVHYKFYKDYIVKDIDTFKLQTQNKTMFFNGNKIDQGEIDAIKLLIYNKGNSKNVFIFKQNDAKTFLK